MGHLYADLLQLNVLSVTEKNLYNPSKGRSSGFAISFPWGTLDNDGMPFEHQKDDDRDRRRRVL